MTLGGIALATAFVLAIPALREAAGNAISGDHDAVRHDLREPGGVLLVIALGLIHTIVWYPAEILDTAAGFVYGFWPALPLVMACWIISGLLAYFIGRHAARPILYRLAGRERFERVEGLIDRGGVTFLLVARLVPIVPFSLTGYVAGAARVPIGRYAWTTAVGYLPITAFFVYVGSQLEEFSPTDPIILIGAGALLLALFGVRHLTSHVARERQAQADPDADARESG